MRALLLVAFLALAPLLLQAQIKTDSLPFKGANTIELTSTLSDEQLFTLTGKYLVSQGFEIESSNKDFGQITTVPKDKGKVFSQYHRYKFAIVEHKVRLSSQIGPSPNATSMENFYLKKSTVWPYMEEVFEGLQQIIAGTSKKYLKL